MSTTLDNKREEAGRRTIILVRHLGALKYEEDLIKVKENLDESAVARSKRLALELAQVHPTQIHTDDLLPSRYLASHIAKIHPCEVRINPELRDWNSGTAEFRLGDPRILQYTCPTGRKANRAPQYGESFNHFLLRFMNAAATVKLEKGETVIIVTGGLNISMLLQWLQVGRPRVNEFTPVVDALGISPGDYATLTRLPSEDAWSIVRLNAYVK